MPEVSIGFYPDVGGTWFLNRMPGRLGLFLGLTASTMNAADCRYVGLADCFVRSNKRGLMLKMLLEIQWVEGFKELHQGVNTVLRQLEKESFSIQPESQLLQHFNQINALMNHYDLSDIVNAILHLETDDCWLQQVKATVEKGSPAAMAMIFSQLKRGRHLSLKQVFQTELNLSVNCVRSGRVCRGSTSFIDRQRW